MAAGAPSQQISAFNGVSTVEQFGVLLGKMKAEGVLFQGNLEIGQVTTHIVNADPGGSSQISSIQLTTGLPDSNLLGLQYINEQLAAPLIPGGLLLLRRFSLADYTDSLLVDPGRNFVWAVDINPEVALELGGQSPNMFARWRKIQARIKLELDILTNFLNDRQDNNRSVVMVVTHAMMKGLITSHFPGTKITEHDMDDIEREKARRKVQGAVGAAGGAEAPNLQPVFLTVCAEELLPAQEG